MAVDVRNSITNKPHSMFSRAIRLIRPAVSNQQVRTEGRHALEEIILQINNSSSCYPCAIKYSPQ